MTVGQLYRVLHECALSLYGPGEAGAVAFYIMEEHYGVTRAGYALERDKTVEPEGLDTILRQLAAGRPVQYITGKAHFCGLQLFVTEGVLVPRPETEELVRWITGQALPGSRIVDIGTGSGAIALALSASIAGAVITATDISPEALSIAARNAEVLRAKIDLIRGDILDPGSRAELAAKGPFDIVVSNPPYIPRGEAASMHTNVRDHEPHTALFVPDDDPLLFYRAITRFAAAALGGGGALYFEVHKDHARQVAGLLDSQGLVKVEVRRDIYGRQRMVRGLKPCVDG